MRLKAKDVALSAVVAGTTVLTSVMLSGGGVSCSGTCGACGFSCLLPLAGLAAAGGISFIPARKTPFRREKSRKKTKKDSEYRSRQSS